MKQQIKNSMRERRDLMEKSEIEEKSIKIKEKLLNLEAYKKSKTIMFFVSFGNEVFTHGMIREALKNKTVVVPKVMHDEIEPSMILDFDNLMPSGKFGIPEPLELMKVAYKSIDVVLVPGIVFDLKGHRIGYGFGYYDKFLHKVSKAVKIGLAFDFQVVEKILEEQHDIPVDIIVTEKRVVECRKY